MTIDVEKVGNVPFSFCLSSVAVPVVNNNNNSPIVANPLDNLCIVFSFIVCNGGIVFRSIHGKISYSNVCSIC